MPKLFLWARNFQKPLNRIHNAELKSIQDLPEFSTHFEEKLYSCIMCRKKMKHEFKHIYQHLKRIHSLSMDDYETQFGYSVKDEGKINNKDKPQERADPLNQPQLNKLDHSQKTEKLHPIKSELSNSNPPHHRSGQLRPVKSHAVKLQTVKSQVTDFRAVQGTFRETLQPPNTDVPTASNPDPSIVKEEPVPISTPKALSFYYCPIPDCSFYTTKEGMKKSQAALHLKNDHKIKAKDMKPGMYKFDKIKV